MRKKRRYRGGEALSCLSRALLRETGRENGAWHHVSCHRSPPHSCDQDTNGCHQKEGKMEDKMQLSAEPGSERLNRKGPERVVSLRSVLRPCFSLVKEETEGQKIARQPPRREIEERAKSERRETTDMPRKKSAEMHETRRPKKTKYGAICLSNLCVSAFPLSVCLSVTSQEERQISFSSALSRRPFSSCRLMAVSMSLILLFLFPLVSQSSSFGSSSSSPFHARASSSFLRFFGSSEIGALPASSCVMKVLMLSWLKSPR